MSVENNILASLSNCEYENLRPHLEDVSLCRGKNIFNYGDSIQYVYFPLDAVVYMFTMMEDGATAEVGVIGSEGIIGVSVLLGSTYSLSHSFTLNNSRALRIRADILKREFEKGGALQQMILQFINAFLVQISQTSACNRIHHLEVRLCRWLLMARDKAKSDDLNVTQEFISRMLGTQRPYITTAIGVLQREKIINCCRGRIEILDYQKLKETACECYQIIQNEFGKLYDAPKTFRSNSNYQESFAPAESDSSLVSISA
ncbi:MAG: Crp/Fnr family transcriptional regulator [Pyrinomonadaceae bacterium]